MGQQSNILNDYSRECDARKQFVEQDQTTILERNKYSYQLAPSIGKGWMDMFQISHSVTIGRACFETPFHCLATESPGMVAMFIVLSGRLNIKNAEGHLLESYGEGSVATGYRHNMKDIQTSYLPESNGKVEIVSIDIPVNFFNQLFANGSGDLSILYSIQSANCLIHSEHLCRHCALSVAQDVMALDCNNIMEVVSIESSVLNLVSMLASHFNHLYPIVDSNTTQRYSKQVSHVVEILETEYHKKHTIASLARAAGLNECYLKVAFKKSTGQTIAEFHRSVRLKRAKSLLETTSCTILEVVHQVGYSNSGHFAAAFRQQFGILPSVMRFK